MTTMNAVRLDAPVGRPVIPSDFRAALEPSNTRAALPLITDGFETALGPCDEMPRGIKSFLEEDWSIHRLTVEPEEN